jgi:superfamily II DNA helicase RecQ
MPTESKKVKQLFEAAHDKLKLETRLMLGLLTHLNKKGFQLTEFVRMKADLLDADEGDEGKAERPSKKEGKAAKAELVPEDILHPEVFEALRLWRLEKSRELKLAAYVVLSQRALVGLSNLLPTTETELKKVPYVGKIVAQKYGAELLEIIFKYKKRQEDKSS